jgi:hypothetical protein
MKLKCASQRMAAVLFQQGQFVITSSGFFSVLYVGII